MQFFKTLSAFVTLGVALVGSRVSATPVVTSGVIARDEAVDLQTPYKIIFIKGPLSRRELEGAEEDLQTPYRIIFVKGTLGRRDLEEDLQNPYRIIFIKSRDDAPGLDENVVDGTDLFDREGSDAKVDLQTPYRIIFIKGT